MNEVIEAFTLPEELEKDLYDREQISKNNRMQEQQRKDTEPDRHPQEVLDDRR